MDERMRCSVTELRNGHELPANEDHEFWVALDVLGTAIAAVFERYGIEPDFAIGPPGGRGSLMTVSSDTPAWAHLSWVVLPEVRTLRGEMIDLIIEHLSMARRALPEAAWEVTIADRALPWDETQERFRLLA